MICKSMSLKNTLVISCSVLLFLFCLLPFCLEKMQTTLPAYLISDPSTGNHLYIQEYGLDLTGVDRKGCTYFFLPAFVSLDRLDQSLSSQHILFSDGSNLDSPNIGEPIDVLVDTGEGEYVPWQIAFLKSENLCTVFLDIDEAGLEKISKDQYLNIGLDIVDAKGYKLTDDAPVLIKGHGNSTWDTEKKPYELKFPDKISLCGLKASNKWLMLANIYDGTKMANKLALDTADAIGMEYTTDSDWVDVYAKGSYLGNYLLCKEPDIGSDSLNIGNIETVNEPHWDPSRHFETEAMKGFVYDPPVPVLSGGYLIDRTRSILYDEKMCGFLIDGTDYFTIKSPNNVSYEQADYIRSFTDRVDASIKGKNEDQLSMIDVPSFTRRFLIEELFFNADTMFSSYYFYKKPGQDKLYAGPVWDHDRSLGFNNRDFFLDTGNTILDNSSYFSYSDSYTSLDWDGLLCANKAYRASLEKTFRDSLPAFRELVYSRIDACYKRIEKSMEMDYILWDSPWSKYEDPYNSIRFTKYFLANRLDHLCDVYNSDADFSIDISDDTTHTVTFCMPDGSRTRISKKDGTLLSSDEIPEYDDDIYLGWYYYGTQDPYSTLLPVLEDVELELLSDADFGN